MDEKNICVICGKENDVASTRCTHCGREVAFDTTLATAYTALNSKNFTTAKALFREYIQSHSKDAEGYFGLACARLGFRYSNLMSSKISLTPTYYIESDIMHDVDFVKALRLASEDVRHEYISAFESVAHILQVWGSKVSKESPYDIYISYKESDLDNGIERTQDSIEAQDLYVYLSSLGYRVFYARESLRGKSEQEREAYIYQALSTSKLMIVYGQKVEYLDSIDMSSEYDRYREYIHLGKKSHDSMIVAYEKVLEDDIHKIFGSVDTIDAHKKSFLIDIRDAVASRLQTKDSSEKPDMMDMHIRKMSEDSFNRKLNRVLGYIMFGFTGLSILCLLVWLFMYNVTGIHKIMSNVLNVTILVSVVTSITLATILAYKDAGNNFKYFSVIVGSCAGLGLAIFALFATNYVPEDIRRVDGVYGSYLYRGFDYDYVVDDITKEKTISIYGMDKFFEAVNWYVTVPKRMLGCDVESMQIVDNEWLHTLYLDTSICQSITIKECDRLKLIDVSITKVITDMHIEDCESLERIAFNDVEVVGNLVIKECDNLKRLNLKNVTKVALSVKDCEDLTNIFIPKASTIHFTIEDCESLGNINLSSVDAVNKLWLIDCPMIDNVDFKAVRTLQNFLVKNCPNIDIIQFRHSIISAGTSMNFSLSEANYTIIVDSRATLNAIDRDESIFNETTKHNYPSKFLISQRLVDELSATLSETISWLGKYDYVESRDIDGITYQVYNRKY